MSQPPPYAELHCKTNFSFLEGAAHADELVLRARELDYAAVAVTDRNSLAGVVRAHAAAQELGLPLVIGAEIVPSDSLPVLLWVTDRAAYARLCRLLTRGRRRAEKGDCRLTVDDIAAHAEGCLAGVVIPPWDEDWPSQMRENHAALVGAVRRYREIFGDRCWLLAELHRGADDLARLDWLDAVAAAAGNVPLVAAGDVHYHVPERIALQHCLTAIRHRTTIDAIRERLFPNAQRHLRTRAEIAELFQTRPELVARTMEIAEACRFSLAELRYEYPEELAPPGKTPLAHLTDLAHRGARKRFPEGVPEKVARLLEHELRLIAELRYEAYFLTVWDIVRFARGRGILCQGRGSAANSVVCYCLGVTSVNPTEIDLLFERFVSKERDEAPDIDIDFEHERREEVLQYLYAKYGRERAGLAATVITYRMRSAVRDVGKALGLSLDRVDALAKNLESFQREPKLAERLEQVGLDPAAPVNRHWMGLVHELLGFPRHLSQHVGGMVITRGPLCEMVPIENAAMPDRTVIQWDKDDLEHVGMLKVDCLCLGMLTAIRKAFDLIERSYGRSLTLASVPQDDGAVYDMICAADTMGVFQIESRAQMSMLPRLRPRCFYDLVIEVSIVRPGPIQGQMVHPYLRRRCGQEPVRYPNDAVQAVLEKTLGVPIFQEQAMRLAVVAAGFTPGEADQLRRAMGAWRKTGVIEKFRIKLLDGMRERGLDGAFAEQVYRQIRGFGEYGFPESHAASFALLVYVSAWIKHYYPEVFCAALLNSQPMGFYAPAQLVGNAREHGVEVRRPDVNHSDWDCTLEPSPRSERQALRLGLRQVRQLSEIDAERIVQARGDGLFQSLGDFRRRTRLPRAVVSRLADADALASLSSDRRHALWESLLQDSRPRAKPLLEGLADDEAEFEAPLPTMSLQQEVFADYRTTGMSLRNHPLAFHRADLDSLGILPIEKLAWLETKTAVKIAGLVLLRQRPGTAKGITFVTLEDETGAANLIIHAETWERHYAVARRCAAWIVQGRVESRQGVTHVIVERLEDLSGRLEEIKVRPREFR